MLEMILSIFAVKYEIRLNVIEL